MPSWCDPLLEFVTDLEAAHTQAESDLQIVQGRVQIGRAVSDAAEDAYWLCSEDPNCDERTLEALHDKWIDALDDYLYTRYVELREAYRVESVTRVGHRDALQAWCDCVNNPAGDFPSNGEEDEDFEDEVLEAEDAVAALEDLLAEGEDALDEMDAALEALEDLIAGLEGDGQSDAALAG